MPQESGPENLTQFEIGNSVVYNKRVWEIRDIQGEEAEIYAPESTAEITATSLIGGHSYEEIAAEWGGVLHGGPYPSTSPDGEKIMGPKVSFPEETKRVNLSDLKPVSSISA